ncbi:hypothetical protein BKA66DRAFT_429211 [Pyrenochaeta sp. MPI-SDFR-AT-0127]|nr:hypothetical protein BKA66DRAFT_429211 [Pyrenochaeta sp. MPI-SDFR-AT-0127]
MEENDAKVLAERRHTRQRNSTPDIRQYRGIYRTRLILRILSLAVCISIITLLVDSVQSYKKTEHVTNPFRAGSGSFPVWPEGLKLYPTFLLLAAAIFASIVSLLLVIASFLKSIRRMTTTGNITTIVISSVCLVVWIAVTAYYETWDSSETNWDLLSWTCTHQDPSYDYQSIDFSVFCTKMRFAFWAGVGLAGLEASNLLIFVVWWLKTRRARGYQKMQEGKDSNHPNWAPGPDALGFNI